MDAVQKKNNRKLKQLFERYGHLIDFTKIKFENGDNSLIYGVRTGNEKLCKLLIIIGTNVC